MTWVEPEDGTVNHFSELHLRRGAKLAFLNKPGENSVKVDNVIGQSSTYLFVGVGHNLEIVKTAADLSFNIRAYENATLKIPFKLYVHGVSVHMGGNSKVRPSMQNVIKLPSTNFCKLVEANGECSVRSREFSAILWLISKLVWYLEYTLFFLCGHFEDSFVSFPPEYFADVLENAIHYRFLHLFIIYGVEICLKAFYFTQLLGLEDLHVFNGGSVHVEPTALIGNGSRPGEIVMNSLHVQNKGYFQVRTIDSENDVSMKLHNISVSILST